VSVCWLTSDIRYAGNSLVSVCWLALISEANQQIDTRELPGYPISEANQQTDTRELPAYLISEANQQTDTRELPAYLSPSDLRSVCKSMVPVC
jgi:hypothetical protein